NSAVSSVVYGLFVSSIFFLFFFFFFNATATTKIYTLSLHDALPISSSFAARRCARARSRVQTPAARPYGVSLASRRASSSDSNRDRKSTRLNSSHDQISYAVFCLKKKKQQ